jgi:hypothetical protein
MPSELPSKDDALLEKGAFAFGPWKFSLGTWMIST